eukprot:5959031-Amphidinium_carterae.1
MNCRKNAFLKLGSASRKLKATTRIGCANRLRRGCGVSTPTAELVIIVEEVCIVRVPRVASPPPTTHANACNLGAAEACGICTQRLRRTPSGEAQVIAESDMWPPPFWVRSASPSAFLSIQPKTTQQSDRSNAQRLALYRLPDRLKYLTNGMDTIQHP